MHFKSSPVIRFILNDLDQADIWCYNWNMFIMAYSTMPYVGLIPPKMAAILKVHKWYTQNAYFRLVKSHQELYKVVPWATELLLLLENITEVLDWQVAETGKQSIFCLLHSKPG